MSKIKSTLPVVGKVSVGSTLKLEEERFSKLTKAIHTYISDKGISIVSDIHVLDEGKTVEIEAFAYKLKCILEGANTKNFPREASETYVALLREVRNTLEKRSVLQSQKPLLNTHTELELSEKFKDEKTKLNKSFKQAEKFMTHKLFLIDSNFAHIITKRTYDVKDEFGNVQTIEKEVLLRNPRDIKIYETTLSQFFVKDSLTEKPKTYWDEFMNSPAVCLATSVYNPFEELYYSDEDAHFYINTYIEPEWKKEPGYFYLMQRHKTDPMTFDKLCPPLKSFLGHFFPNKETRNEVLKWCAFSRDRNLQTYLTLIGSPGIGKGLFVEDLLGYYHGETNMNKPKSIEDKYDAKNASSTLLYFDEQQMVTLNQYNTMKLFTNDTLNYEEKNQKIFSAINYANVVWSCNTKDTMSAMSRDDRRFKIVPLTNIPLLGLKILDNFGNEIGNFNSSYIKTFKEDRSIKDEFVLLMLSIKEHVERNKESLDDINSITENESRDTIFEESRSMDFTEIIDTLKVVFNDYNPITEKFGRVPTPIEKEEIGTIYLDYIPLSKLKKAKNSFYTYRVPHAVVRKVIEAKAGKGKPMSARFFNKHLDNMPPKILKAYSLGGQMRDIEIRLLDKIETSDKPAHESFLEKYGPQLKEK